MGVQAAGVVDGAGGDNEAHPSTLAGRTEARRDAGAGRPEHRVTRLTSVRYPGTAPAPDQGPFLRHDPAPEAVAPGDRDPAVENVRHDQGL
ncbi:conserved domain protein [Actinomyces sp. oral taxon 170 str. F0386]|nr:conserved domain protein [Actinomyces sp. oral taxon 170 str. F0386]